MIVQTKRIKTFLILLCSFSALVSYAQQNLSEKDLAFFKQKEKELQALQNEIYASKEDSVRTKLNWKFQDLWESVLIAEYSFSFPFDSLSQVGRLMSPDNNFRIINWNIPKIDGTKQSYYGFIQTYNKKEKKYEVHKLVDRSETITKNPETYIGTPEKWFGMLYYKIVPCKDYYLLFAWDGNNKLTQRKFIDVLHFKSNGDPVFGKDVFRIPRKNPRRIVFEYSAEISMSLKYNEQKNMIVFDHLAPKDEYMEGQYQFYGPDFSYDGFEYIKGKWKYIEDVDAKNSKNKNDNVHHDNKKKEKPIYTPN